VPLKIDFSKVIIIEQQLFAKEKAER